MREKTGVTTRAPKAFHLHVEKVHVGLQSLDIKMLKIPERCRDGNGVSRAGRGFESLLQALGQGDKVLIVLATATPVIGHGVLPVEVDAVKVILLQELDDRLDELVHVLGGSSNIAEGGPRRTWVVEGPSADGDVGAEVGIRQLEGVEALVQVNVGLCGGLDLQGVGVDGGKGKVEVRVNTPGYLLGVEGVTWPIGSPSFVVANDAGEGLPVDVAARSLGLVVAAELFRGAAVTMLGAAD